MKTTVHHPGSARGPRGALAALSLAVTLFVTSRDARAQNYIVVTEVPDHVYLLRGYSFGNGHYVALEPSAMFFDGPVGRPLAMVARGVLGLGGSGAAVGLASNLMPECRPGGQGCWKGDDFFMGPFVSLEARVEGTYFPLGWRRAIYTGPQLELSIYVLKASVGWMVDVTERTNHHLQIGVGGGF